MATMADEFDPPQDMFVVVVRQILIPQLDRIAAETSLPYIAKVDVWIQDRPLAKCSLSLNGVGDYDVEENVLVRLRFRRTIREDRHLFAVETQHAKWQHTGFSGIHIRGEIVVNSLRYMPQLNSITIRYNVGWTGW